MRATTLLSTILGMNHTTVRAVSIDEQGMGADTTLHWYRHAILADSGSRMDGQGFSRHG
jgi:hypothetical protein